MSKKPKSTKAALIAEAQAKLAEANSMIADAKTDFASAETGPAREEAQARLNTAAADAERWGKTLEALSGDRDQEDDGPQTHIAATEIHLDGKVYKEGDDIELTAKQLASLPAGDVKPV